MQLGRMLLLTGAVLVMSFAGCLENGGGYEYTPRPSAKDSVVVEVANVTFFWREDSCYVFDNTGTECISIIHNITNNKSSDLNLEKYMWDYVTEDRVVHDRINQITGPDKIATGGTARVCLKITNQPENPITHTRLSVGMSPLWAALPPYGEWRETNETVERNQHWYTESACHE